MARKQTSKKLDTGFLTRSRIVLFVLSIATIGTWALISTYAASLNVGHESAMYTLHNNHRAASGRKMLAASGCLQNAARETARRNADRNNLAHTGDLRGLVRKHCGSKANQAAIGENVGHTRGASAGVLFNTYLGSPGHRANIDNPSWHMFGIGAANATDGSVYDTIIFVSCASCTDWIGAGAGSGSAPSQEQFSSYEVKRQGRCTGKSHTGNWLGARATDSRYTYDLIPIWDANGDGKINAQDEPNGRTNLKATNVRGGGTDAYVWWKNRLPNTSNRQVLWGVKAYRKGGAGTPETRIRYSGPVAIGPCFKVDFSVQCLSNGKGRIRVKTDSPRNGTTFDIRLIRNGGEQSDTYTLRRIPENSWRNIDVPASWVSGSGSKFAIKAYEWSSSQTSAGGTVVTDKTDVKTLKGCQKDSTVTASGTGTATPFNGGNTNAQSGFSVTYVDNSTRAVRTGTVNGINHNWGTGAPVSGIGRDHFTIAWSGTFKAPATGTYTFYAVHDDGFIMKLNGVSIIDNWASGTGQAQRSVNLKKGQTLQVEAAMYDLTGGSYAALRWSGPGLTGIPVFPETNQTSFDFN